MLSPNTSAQHDPAMNSLPTRNACAMPPGRLHCVLKIHSPSALRPHELPKSRHILRRRNDQHVPYPRQHQRRQRIIDHRLVIDRQQALLTAWVTGYNRVPDPPARMIPLTSLPYSSFSTPARSRWLGRSTVIVLFNPLPVFPLITSQSTLHAPNTTPPSCASQSQMSLSAANPIRCSIFAHPSHIADHGPDCPSQTNQLACAGNTGTPAAAHPESRRSSPRLRGSAFVSVR